MADDGAGLFDDLPGQGRSEPRPSRLPRLRQAERDQVELRSSSLEDLVASDHRVRLVWAFCETLDLGPLYRAIKAVEGRPGHPPADPRILVALWLFATTEGVGSARALARLCEQHVAYQWLCGGVSMNHKTLADFRVAHGAVLEGLLVDSFAALLRSGIASLDRVAQDGVRVRASAGAASFRRRSTLKECHRAAKAHVARLRSELEADPSALSRREAAARERAAADRLRRVEAAVAAADALDAARRKRDGNAAARAGKAAPPEAAGEAPEAPSGAAQANEAPPCEAGTPESAVREPRVSTTDAEARVMKMADGGFRPAFNVQYAADTKSGAVAGVSVDNVGSDMGKMAPMSDALAASYGTRPGEHLADGGYAKLADIDHLAAAGVTAFVPVPKPRDPTRDRFARRPDDTDAVAAWRARMNTDGAKTTYKQRAATSERVNAQARNSGLTRFIVRGIDKAKAVACWHGLANNMACSWRFAPA